MLSSPVISCIPPHINFDFDTNYIFEHGNALGCSSPNGWWYFSIWICIWMCSYCALELNLISWVRMWVLLMNPRCRQSGWLGRFQQKKCQWKPRLLVNKRELAICVVQNHTLSQIQLFSRSIMVPIQILDARKKHGKWPLGQLWLSHPAQWLHTFTLLPCWASIDFILPSV